MKKIILILTLFLFFDLAYSFVQYYNSPIGGDIAEVVLPKKGTGYLNQYEQSELNARLLKHWGIKKHLVLYIQE